MKKLSFLTVISMLLLFACSPNEPISRNLHTSTQQLVAQVGHINDQGQAELSISSAKLEAAFIQTYELQAASDMRIVENEIGYFLQGNCFFDENIKVSFAIFLDLDINENLTLAAGSSTQSCTSSTGCKGCELKTLTVNSGSCDCIASNEWPDDPGNGECIHSVSVSIQGSMVNYPQGPLTLLIENINA